MIGKVISARAAIDLIQTGEPRHLTVFHVCGIGDWKSSGLNRLTGEGLVRRDVGGHYGMSPKYAQLILDNKIEAYAWPQGVMSQWLREVAAGRPGLLTHIGLKTFIDPRLEGARLNARTTEDLIEVVRLGGRDWLFYRAFRLNVCFIRGRHAHGDRARGGPRAGRDRTDGVLAADCARSETDGPSALPGRTDGVEGREAGARG